MKMSLRFCATLALMSAMMIQAMAGEMGMGYEPPPSTSSTCSTLQGEMGMGYSPCTTEEGQTGSTLTTVVIMALGILEGLPGF